MSVLTATNVTKSYGAVRAVDGVSLEVSAGEIVALLGHNGSGKTSLLECIEGLRRPDSGRIEILGREHSYMARVPDGLGVQLQEEQLPSRIKVREALWLYSHIYAVPDAPQDLMEAMDIAPLLGKRFDALSGGQKRRVNLCLAFIGQPELVLLDEPTAGLDPEAQRALVQVLQRRRNEGLAVLMTLHEVDHATELADRVVVMAHGQIAATGTVSELIASLNATACAVLTSGTDAGPWQEVGDVQHGPEDTWLVFGNRAALQQAMSTLPGGEAASLRPVGLGDVVTRAAQQEVTR